jgi:hypothetical protein
LAGTAPRRIRGARLEVARVGRARAASDACVEQAGLRPHPARVRARVRESHHTERRSTGGDGRGSRDNGQLMGRRVIDEIAQLPVSLKAASELDLRQLAGLLKRAAGRPAVFVGSGGALAAARLAADLYTRFCGGVGYIQTPLELVARAAPAAQAGFLFTASGGHPDAYAAVRRLAIECDPCAVITTNPSPQLDRLCERVGVPLVNLGNPAGKDGFLATNSLAVMAIAMTRALTGKAAPENFPWLVADYQLPPAFEEVLVLFPPGLAAVATDIEARLTETGLAAVQVADYRNFAHGRHAGLARRAARSMVLALVDEACRQLAERTLDLLPGEVPQLRLESKLAPPWDAVDLLVASMRITAGIGEVAGLDPGRPQVPAFGRRLYRLHIGFDRGGAASIRPRLPIRLKLRELGAHVGPGVISSKYEAAYDDWFQRLRRMPFAAIALDYDGTVVSTNDRFNLPDEQVREQLNRLLDSGVMIGFASGRGDSLMQDLRRWVPKPRWQQLYLGLYNGAVMIRLDQDLPERDSREPAFDEAERRLSTLPMFGQLTIVDRHYQLQVVPREDADQSIPALAGAVAGVLRRPPQLPLEVVMSAHSLDVLPVASTKVALLDAVVTAASGAALAIGDQGQLGGNDFALLAAQELTLSVDRCSPDPTRCWRLVAPHSGPAVLCRYLAALEPSAKGLRFRWRSS